MSNSQFLIPNSFFLTSIKSLSFCLLFFVTLSSYAQTKYGIKNIYAYYAQHLPGNIPVDDNGNSLYKGPDTLITVYIETTGQEPHWSNAWRGNKVYSIVTTLIKQPTIEAGIRKSSNQKILVSPAKGNCLWQLEFVPQESRMLPPQKMKPGEIILRGKYKSKTFLQKISRLIELRLPDSV